MTWFVDYGFFVDNGSFIIERPVILARLLYLVSSRNL